MRYRLFIILLLCTLSAKADEGVRDSVQVQEVQISASRKKHFGDGFREQELSKTTLDSYSNRTLGEVLLHKSNINIRSYGSPGASTTISFRGLGASQTQVNWNGFPINSVTLGSADVSNVMLSTNNSVSLVPGAAGVTYGSGTFGGVVNIEYDPHNQIANKATVEVGLGSFNSYNVAGNYNAKLKKLSLSGNVWGHVSEANFDYYDEIKQKDLERQNADYNQYGFEQMFSFSPDNYTEVKGGIWGQVKDMNIPAIEGASLKSYENQKDSTLRLFLSYKKTFVKSAINARGAWFYTDQHYIQKDSIDAATILINSRIKSKAWFGDFNYRMYLTDNLTIDAGFNYSYTHALVDAYDGKQVDEVFGIVGGIRYVNKISGNIAIRKDWSNNVDSDILVNAGVSYPLTKEIDLRAAFSQKFRRPTFNDLFWKPGGNPDLKPENGYSFEGGANYIVNDEFFGSFEIDLSAYYSAIKDMIVWRPEGALWYAKNYNDVLTRGIDLKINHKKELRTLNWQTSAALTYNSATIESVNEEEQSRNGQPLYYAPQWRSNITSGVSRNSYTFNVNWNFVSKQYYDDSKYSLDPYWLMDMSISKSFNFSSQQLFTQFSIENIFDKRYQTIRSYPMPGRVWQLKIKYILN